jgi:hypothetical protein|tara:strand:- start:18 stop:203 length:186 start_codon:yes stop_codon:yes gene_type:complete
MKILFRWVDVDEIKGDFDTTYKEIIDQIKDWNIDMETEYKTIQQFNDGEEYYSIELNLTNL